MKLITTPTGTARYCWLNSPDTKFDEAGYGVYRCELILQEEDWNSLKKDITPLYEDAYQAECLKQGKPKLKQANSPFVVDDDNNYVIKTKLKGGGKRLDGTEYRMSVARFDSLGKPVKTEEIIGAGSKLKLALKVRFWFVAAHGFGMTLEPHGVQIIELEALGTSENAEAFGFSTEESGYQHGGETFEDTLNQPETTNDQTEKEEAPSAANF
jgi:hypothetical protein